MQGLPAEALSDDGALRTGAVVDRASSGGEEVAVGLVARAPQIIEIQAAARRPVIGGTDRQADIMFKTIGVLRTGLVVAVTRALERLVDELHARDERPDRIGETGRER